eukprot:TRINITY_DN3809_c3_g1_i1.p1 TRINITY_DN3809_c3_g1~~TRINITY_DN3809_c3_g1_i1.p1  ORF type:complete len:139 (+),score=0.10 TRINITY_DN3809_c3_g1_i1:288-704(+)
MFLYPVGGGYTYPPSYPFFSFFSFCIDPCRGLPHRIFIHPGYFRILFFKNNDGRQDPQVLGVSFEILENAWEREGELRKSPSCGCVFIQVKIILVKEIRNPNRLLRSFSAEFADSSLFLITLSQPLLLLFIGVICRSH